MTEYLGISMVVIVISMCIGILSTIVSEAIFKQIEAHRRRVTARNLEIWEKLLEGGAKYLGKYTNELKELVKTAKKADDEHLILDDEMKKKIFDAAIKAADEAVKETI